MELPSDHRAILIVSATFSYLVTQCKAGENDGDWFGDCPNQLTVLITLGDPASPIGMVIATSMQNRMVEDELAVFGRLPRAETTSLDQPLNHFRLNNSKDCKKETVLTSQPPPHSMVVPHNLAPLVTCRNMCII